MARNDKINILMVDDQPGKLMSYEVILSPLNANLLKASSAAEALQTLLKTEVAVLLVDVCMPDLDGFQFAAMVREHPRFQKTAIIFISAIHLSEFDSVKGYELGAVDYVSVPVVPELLRAKVRVFVDLYRKSAELEQLNAELEARVAQRTKELENSIKHQELLAREVDHRAKNVLAVVQSLVRLTKAKSIEEFGKAVNGRVRAMACAHTLLSETRWQGAELRRLLEEELAPYQGADRILMRGPSVTLRPAIAQVVALAVHELGTNAAKYGSLSRDGGRVMLTWRLADTSVELVWDEVSGPPVAPPAATGFGTKIIEACVADQSKGEVMFDWRASGLKCTLRIPDAFGESEPPWDKELRRPAPIETPHGHRALAGARVMLVEDEALIALMVGDILSGSGAEVIGPFSTLAPAMSCAEPFDIALLDVNVAGQPVYALADLLVSQNKPFVFATGYDDGRLETRFGDKIVLQKPIEPSVLVSTLASVLVGHEQELQKTA